MGIETEAGCGSGTNAEAPQPAPCEDFIDPDQIRGASVLDSPFLCGKKGFMPKIYQEVPCFSRRSVYNGGDAISGGVDDVHLELDGLGRTL